MREEQWHSESALTLFFPEMHDSRPAGQDSAQNGLVAVAIMLNATAESRDFSLPEVGQAGAWKLAFNSAESTPPQTGPAVWNLSSRSMACALYTA